jgi:hypothetical protein
MLFVELVAMLVYAKWQVDELDGVGYLVFTRDWNVDC